MNKKLNKGLTTTLAVLILSSSVPSYGAKARFKDVPTNYWGYTYIEEMVKKGYLNGMGDGSFNPTGNLTFIQSMSALSNLRKPTKGDKIRASNMYGMVLDDLKVKEEWKRNALNLALYQGIINENELRNIAKQGFLNKPVQREVLSVYLAKAMGLEEEAQNKSVVHVPYKDNGSITPSFVRYIEVLLDANVLSPKGTGEGKLEPKSYLNRAQLATMLYNADAYLLKNPIVNKNPGVEQNKPNIEVPPIKPKDPIKPIEPSRPIEQIDPIKPIEPAKPVGNIIETKTAKIKRITNDLGRNILVIEDRYGNEEGYFIQSTTDIKLSGISTNLDELEIGQRVELKYNTASNNLISITGEASEHKYEGTIDYLDFIKNKVIVEYIDGNQKLKKDLFFDLDTYIYVNGKKSSIKDVREKDIVEVKTRGNYIYELNSNSKELKIEDGIIKEIIRTTDARKDDIEIIVEDKNGSRYTFITDSKTLIYRKKRSARAEDLRVKDRIFIQGEYDKRLESYLAFEIEADVIKSTVKGHIVEVSNRINHNTSIVVRNMETRKEESYVLTNDAYIKVDREVVSSLPSNPGYYVEINLEGDEIIDIYADSSSLESASLGKISSINYSARIIEIEIENINYEDEKRDRYLTVYLEKDTIISDRRLDKLELRDLRPGNTINVVGKYKGRNFVADSISVR